MVCFQLQCTGYSQVAGAVERKADGEAVDVETGQKSDSAFRSILFPHLAGCRATARALVRMPACATARYNADKTTPSLLRRRYIVLSPYRLSRYSQSVGKDAADVEECAGRTYQLVDAHVSRMMLELDSAGRQVVMYSACFADTVT